MQRDPATTSRRAWRTSRAAILGGAFFMVSTTAQSLFNSQLGDSQAEPSPLNLAIYHSLNVPAFALMSLSLAAFYSQYSRRISLFVRACFLSVIALILLVIPAIMVLALSADTFGAAVESAHRTVLPMAIGAMFGGSVLLGVVARKVNAAPFVPALLLALGPVIVLSLSLGGVNGLLLVPSKLLMGFGWLWFGSSLHDR